MKKIFWGISNITVLSGGVEAAKHAHLMLQIFINKSEQLKVTIDCDAVFGNYIVVDGTVAHSVSDTCGPDCFILIAATSDIVGQIRNRYIGSNGYAVLPVEKAHEAFLAFCERPDERTNAGFSSALFGELGIAFCDRWQYDRRVVSLLERLNDYSVAKTSVEEIAKSLFLSKSRLSHLFREQTGVPLKSYIVLCTLQKAYRLMLRGKSITEAAVEAGFYSPSHLADVNRKMMGMTISEAIKDSCFLEVVE